MPLFFSQGPNGTKSGRARQVKHLFFFFTVPVSRTCAGRDLRPQPAHLNWHKRGLERESVNHTRRKCWARLPKKSKQMSNKIPGGRFLKPLCRRYRYKKNELKAEFFGARVDSGGGHVSFGASLS